MYRKKMKKKDIDNTSVVTIIGSTRFESKMKDFAQQLQSCGILPLMTFVTKEQTNYTYSDYSLMKEGYKRIDISDYIYCINNDGYIGNNTLREYYYATFIARVPVYFMCHEFNEYMINNINFIWEDTRGIYHPWYDCISSLDIERVILRDNLKIRDEFISMVEPGYDFKTNLIDDIKKQTENPNVKIDIVSDEEFETLCEEINKA